MLTYIILYFAILFEILTKHLRILKKGQMRNGIVFFFAFGLKGRRIIYFCSCLRLIFPGYLRRPNEIRCFLLGTNVSEYKLDFKTWNRSKNEFMGDLDSLDLRLNLRYRNT